MRRSKLLPVIAVLLWVLILALQTTSTTKAHGLNQSQNNLGHNNQGDKGMTANELIQALRQVDARQESAMTALSQRVEKETRDPIRAVVGMLADPDPKVSEKAALLITGVGDLAIVPLIEAPKPEAPVDRVWNMTVVLQAHIAERDQVAARLDSMLDDRAAIPWSKPANIEGAVQPSRVCDEAYLLMRRLLNTSEGKMQFTHERKAFLSLPDKEKDIEIAKARKSRIWTNLVHADE